MRLNSSIRMTKWKSLRGAHRATKQSRGGRAAAYLGLLRFARNDKGNWCLTRSETALNTAGQPHAPLLDRFPRTRPPNRADGGPLVTLASLPSAWHGSAPPGLDPGTCSVRLAAGRRTPQLKIESLVCSLLHLQRTCSKVSPPGRTTTSVAALSRSRRATLTRFHEVQCAMRNGQFFRDRARFSQRRGARHKNLAAPRIARLSAPPHAGGPSRRASVTRTTQRRRFQGAPSPGEAIAGRCNPSSG
jgi:hypothetical protein